MKDWKINRKLSRTELEVIYILASSAGVEIINGSLEKRDRCRYVSMMNDKELGLWAQCNLIYKSEITYEEALEYLKNKIISRKT